MPQLESVGEWMEYSRSHLAAARAAVGPDILLAIPSFQAQQAAETAIKEVLIHLAVRPPRIHDIGQLLDLLPAGVPVPATAQQARVLRQYAFATRYPGGSAPVSEDDYRDALRLAEAVVAWAEQVIGREPPQ